MADGDAELWENACRGPARKAVTASRQQSAVAKGAERKLL
jgi:hypothetical protein